MGCASAVRWKTVSCVLSQSACQGCIWSQRERMLTFPLLLLQAQICGDKELIITSQDASKRKNKNKTFLMLVLRREETHTDNYFLSSLPDIPDLWLWDSCRIQCREKCWLKRPMPYSLLGDCNECGYPTLFWVTVGVRWLWQRWLRGVSSPQLSKSDSTERKWSHTWKPPLCHDSSQPIEQWAAMRLRGSGLVMSKPCSLSPGRIWGKMSDMMDDAECLSRWI